VALFVPTLKIGAVIRVVNDVDLGQIDIFASEFADEFRNPLAFVHGGLNLIPAQMMGKPAPTTEDKRADHRSRLKE
ncbi:MAG: hypothetical protein M3R29_03235, partial [Verrucomicrobiota bacterium]|nr:hypothetical protein [Verrucomicrobiota bacterium]